MMKSARVLLLLLVVLPLGVAGCDKTGSGTAGEKTKPTLGATAVQKKTIPIWIKFLGKTKAVNSVDIRARVQGFLQEQSFDDGQNVAQGDVLFRIEPDQYQVQLDMANAQLAKDKAALDYANSRAKRYEPLMEKDFASRDTYDEYRAQAAEANAATMADRAQVRDARLNLSYCSVTSPIDGRISEAQVDVGNLVGATEMTVLATVVQLDPIHVVFNPSENFARWIAGTARGHDAPRPVKVSLPGSRKVYRGQVDYFANQVDPDTNTLRVRARLNNPDNELLPGMYVSVHLFVDQAAGTMLVPQQAIMEGQGGKFVYVVDKDGKIKRTPIEAPHLYNGFQVVASGLKEGQTVLVEGLQKVRPGMEVQPRMMEFKIPLEEGESDSDDKASGVGPNSAGQGAGAETTSPDRSEARTSVQDKGQGSGGSAKTEDAQ